VTDLASLLLIFLTALLGGLLLQSLAILRVRARTQPQQTPFLGGHPPQKHAWSRYHVRYYPMTLLFIAFEMEMMFMYPWAVVFVREGGHAMAEMGMFLGILSVGVAYAWREGALRWQ